MSHGDQESKDKSVEAVEAGGLTRRAFVKTGSLYGAGFVLSLHTSRPAAAKAAAESATPVLLTPDEWKTLEAVTARIIPTDHQPGAREANCVNFIDKAIANEDAAALPLYKGGLAALDGVAQARFGADFVSLSEEEQDAILSDLEKDKASEWAIGAQLPASLFFETVRIHTLVGFLADPSYGGNYDFAGWRVAGYPGPRHRRGGFTPEQVEGKAPIVPIWER